ncbi:PTS sugar transporter subunit IIB [Paenibacillus macerans]|uniref:PTS sugar transporter subunit IIB n=2 Tax=Paenibacillus TaxID=44249 RepID=A0A090ZP83_PAEMA|nr:PTS system, Lactose/Cellobiose specific IIB subunit [Paenibacillus macerans]MBS5915127.1 PTS sugar transporter subunit IIB [Paenibacillus macerans]MUG23543.1 PTS sugar transporter subunit IIB [Paenibacillus macerans]SUA84227.1 PTS system lactose/cellobiose-specific transporter subunit IIB [Paenibacillus macerans]GBK60115.1 PTS sugar transporter subunit IIB [Paenibacillus macerans]
MANAGEMVNVLLICGSGASSGFMAANIRKAAKKRNLNMDIKARGEAEIENYIHDIDALLVGPHLAYIMDDINELTKDTDVKVLLMKPSYYSTLDGEAALDDLLSELNS